MAGFIAQEKFKKLKNGEFNRHMYYSCARRVDPNCKEKYINETNLRVLLQEFIEENHKNIKITHKLQAKVERHYSATNSLLRHYKVEQILDSPLIEDTRYVLSNGNEAEKSALAKNIVSKVTIKKGLLHLGN